VPIKATQINVNLFLDNANKIKIDMNEIKKNDSMSKI